jgi:very-short-patch-repair endonuclease
MTTKKLHAKAWALARGQHGVVTRAQLLALGFSDAAIRHRLADGRLHRVWRGVYAVGRPELTRRGTWMAATLTCDAVLSGSSAAALWDIRPDAAGLIEVAIAAQRVCRRAGIVVRRRRRLETTRRDGIPVTSPTCTLVDLAARLDREPLEAAINEADKLGLIDPETLRMNLAKLDRRPGLANLRRVLDRETFTLTDSELERRFLPIVRRVGLPKPLTRERVNGFTVDFYWPELGLVVETDGLTYHRTPAQQARDRLRDQTHAAAGLTPLRFTRAQVRFEPRHVEATLEAVAARLRR